MNKHKHDRPYFKADIRLYVTVDTEKTKYWIEIFTTINNTVQTTSKIQTDKFTFFELIDELKLSHTPTITIGSTTYSYFTFKQ